jgi:glyoxylate carboligase
MGRGRSGRGKRGQAATAARLSGGEAVEAAAAPVVPEPLPAEIEAARLARGQYTQREAFLEALDRVRQGRKGPVLPGVPLVADMIRIASDTERRQVLEHYDPTNLRVTAGITMNNLGAAPRSKKGLLDHVNRFYRMRRDYFLKNSTPESRKHFTDF